MVLWSKLLWIDSLFSCMSFEGVPKPILLEQKERESLRSKAQTIFERALSYNDSTGPLHMGNMSSLFKKAIVELGFAADSDASKFGEMLSHGDIVLGELNALILKYNKEKEQAVIIRPTVLRPEPKQYIPNQSAKFSAPLPITPPVRPFTEVDQPELEGFKDNNN